MMMIIATTKDNALAIRSIQQPHPLGTQCPILLDPNTTTTTTATAVVEVTVVVGAANAIGNLPSPGIQTSNIVRNVMTCRDMLHHEPHEGSIDGIDTLGCHRR